jgi:lysyl-tRNA synthetase class 1
VINLVENRFWIENIIEEILKRKADQIVLNSGKSISGKVHIGIFRELLICDSLKRKLEEEGKKVKFFFVVDDYDPAKRFPPYIPKDYNRYIGRPFSDIPNPNKSGESYAEYFANELISTFQEFGLEPEIIWTSKLYQTEQMKNIIRLVLEKVDLVREILIKFIGATLSDEVAEEYERDMQERYPVSVICNDCGRMQITEKGNIIPNRVLDYDSKNDTIKYYCNNCRKEYTIKLDNARLKLNWRVDWPAKWKILGVICEPAGKDHTVKGGAYDTGLEISERVFNFKGPVKVPYEWLRFGEQDMKTHKGIIFTPEQYLKIGGPELLRFLILRTDPNKHISFRPEFIPQYIDEYERLERIYFDQENDISDQEKYDSNIVYPLCQIEKVPKKPRPKLPFRFAIIFSQLKSIMDNNTIIQKAEEVVKKNYDVSEITNEIRENILKTIEKAENWISSYSDERYKIRITDEVSSKIKQEISEPQKELVLKLIELLDKTDLTEDEIQNKVFEIINNTKNLKVKKGFEIIYKIILGKNFGPRLGSFLISLDKEWLIERLRSVLK